MANRFDQLIDQWDAVLRRAFLDAVYGLRDRAQLDQIVRMLEKGDVNGALRAVGLDPAAFRTFERSLENAFAAGGDEVMRRLPTVRDAAGFRLNIDFSVRNTRAEQWLREHSSRLVREILDDQRDMIRVALTDGLSRGANPRATGLDLVGRLNAATGRREGGFIGLTSSQERWVRNYADELASDNPLAALERELRDKRFDGAVRKAAAEGRPIPAELRQKMVTAYKNRALRYRAETIARTESMAALHQSQDEAMRQAVDAGVVDQATVTFVWRTARDTRVRDSHRAMNGQERKMGTPFTTGTGARLRYPGDPLGPASEIIQCRCWREPKFDFFAGVT